jgi:glucose/arabinose dehydrogenase
LVNDKLINPKLLLDLPYKPGPSHNGGVVTIGPDENVYVVVGNLIARAFNNGSQENTLDQNINGGDAPDGRGGILRISQEGKAVNDGGILGKESPLKFYFAYGIRNSFGIAFDPISGYLWDTENGGMYDEINLVEAGFNSGWNKIIGKSSIQKNFNESELVNFGGKGKYSDPEFSLISDRDFRSSPTAIVFFNSNKFGEEFKNDMFVADIRGNIYHFDLNDDRTELSLSGSLADKVADNSSEVQRLRFANMTDVITDIDVGPDGYMYTTLYDKKGAVFRIIPKNP